MQRLATASANGVDSKHVPYRDSKLTRILQPALAGPGRTAIVAAVTPSAKHVNETYSTLNFVGVAKSVLISAKTNVVKGGLGANAAYDSEITKELRSQIATDNIVKKHMQEEMERALAELSEAGARIAAAEARADAAAAAAEFAERAAVASKAQMTAAELRASERNGNGTSPQGTRRPRRLCLWTPRLGTRRIRKSWWRCFGRLRM